MSSLCINTARINGDYKLGLKKSELADVADLNKDGLLCSQKEIEAFASNVPEIKSISNNDIVKIEQSMLHFFGIKPIEDIIISMHPFSGLPQSGNAFSPLNYGYWPGSMNNSIEYTTVMSSSATPEDKLLYMLKDPSLYAAKVFENIICFYSISKETLQKIIGDTYFKGTMVETAVLEKLRLLGK